MTISGKTILITGANRGIGLALVQAALAKGARRVYATYRSLDNRQVLADLGDRVEPLHLDLSETATIDALAGHVTSLDILVNNAGTFTAQDPLGDTEAALRVDLETNLFGTLAVTKALLPAIEASGRGAIANVSSIAALAAMPSFGGYSASKAALHSVTQSMRASVKERQISVHGVYPGPVATRLTAGMEMETTSPAVVAENILNGVENQVEEIFPDGMSQQVGPLFLSDPKQLERTFAGF